MVMINAVKAFRHFPDGPEARFAVYHHRSMTWPDTVLEQWELLNLYTTDESDFYGPFNSLLNVVFPVAEHYQVAPQLKKLAGSLDFTVVFIVSKRRLPIMFVEIKTYASLEGLSNRHEADQQMRDRFRAFADATIALSKLVGISAFGPQFSVYEYSKTSGRLAPPLIPAHPELINDTAPRARWAYNLLEPIGEAKFRDLVHGIKEEIAATLN